MGKLSKSFDLVSIGLKKSDFELFIAGKGREGGKLAIEISLDFEPPQEIEADRFDIILKSISSVRGLDSNDNQVFTLSAEYHGGFKIIDKDVFDRADEDAKVNCCFSCIFPIVRDDMLHMLNRAGLRQINLPWSFNDFVADKKDTLTEQE